MEWSVPFCPPTGISGEKLSDWTLKNDVPELQSFTVTDAVAVAMAVRNRRYFIILLYAIIYLDLVKMIIRGYFVVDPFICEDIRLKRI